MRLPQEILAQASAIDLAAMLWFALCWLGYNHFVDHRLGARGLVGVAHGYRREWARQMLTREMRVSDAALVGNLMSSVSFYANTTIYIIAGLLAVWGALDKVISATQELPFARAATRELWEMKLILLAFVFVVAYFKFTWSLRQMNFLSILIGAAPPPQAPAAERERFAAKLGAVNSFSGDEFNLGIRAYYFGLAATSWFIHPWLFVVATTLVVGVLARRDFASPTLKVLHEHPPSRH